MAEGITLDEWAAEIERLAARAEDGQTAAEMAALTGACIYRVRKMLARAKAAGRLVIARKAVISIDGRPMHAPCYTILRQEPKQGAGASKVKRKTK